MRLKLLINSFINNKKGDKMKSIREYIAEAKMKPKVRFTNFDIVHNNEVLFSNENADMIDNKLKTAKFQKILSELKIMRHNEDGVTDVTKLFIK